MRSVLICIAYKFHDRSMCVCLYGGVQWSVCAGGNPWGWPVWNLRWQTILRVSMWWLITRADRQEDRQDRKIPMSVSVRENNKQLNRLGGTGRERERLRWWQCPGNRVKLLCRLLLFFLVDNLPLSRQFITQGALSNADSHKIQENYYCDYVSFSVTFPEARKCTPPI